MSEAAGAPAWAPGLRHLTADEPPIPLRLRERPEDFEVEELPAFRPGGRGEHLFLFVEKRGLSTEALAARARAVFDLAPAAVGFAGRKDADAVTRQWISLAGVPSERAAELEDERVRVLEVTRNDRKLRLGALAGNRFRLLLRGVDARDLPRLARSLERLSARGLPNYFGAQRFGRAGRAHELGRRLLEGDARGYLLALLGPDHAPPHEDLPELHEAVRSGERRALRGLRRLAPRLPREHARLARQLARRPGDWESALRALDRSTLTIHLSALQARVFNRLLASRLERFDAPLRGDVLAFHGGRSRFEVGPEDDLEDLARRAARQELSPTGLLFGAHEPLAGGEPGELERAAILAEGLDPGDLTPRLDVPLPGGRRHLRVPLRGLSHAATPEGVRLEVELPPGSFATTLVAELSKRP
jgi:tRNA pseudouridine13 synthase